MANYNPKNQIKSSEQAREMGRKSKRGVSIKSALKKQLETGKIDVDKLAGMFFIQAMKGNSAYAKMIMEYIDGKVKDQIETTDMTAPKKIVIEVVKSKK